MYPQMGPLLPSPLGPVGEADTGGGLDVGTKLGHYP